MRAILVSCGWCVLAVVVTAAQQPAPAAPDLKSIATSTDVVAIVERLKSQPPNPSDLPAAALALRANIGTERRWPTRRSTTPRQSSFT